MAPLNSIANCTNPRLGFAAPGRLQPKPCPPCPFLCRPIAVGPIRLYTWEAAGSNARDEGLRRWGLPHQGVQHRLRLTAIVGSGSRHYDPPTAWPVRHRLSAPPSRICRDPRGWGQSARPFFCGLLRAIEQHLIPVDPLQGFVALGQLLPHPAKSLLLQPDRETPLNRFVGRKAWGQPLPPDPRHQDIEHGMPTLPVVVGRTPIATPDHRRENRLKERPHVLGHLTGKISQLHALLLPLCFLDPVRITQGGGFVSQT